MTKKIHLTIGIPAYNEAGNIGLLLQDISSQSYERFVLDRVHVVSDASTDQTNAIVKRHTNLPIRLVVHKKRQGIATALNEILSGSTSDVVIILNADVRIRDPEFLHKLSKPIVMGKADLTSCNLIASNNTSLIARALDVSMQVKTEIFETIKRGDNVYCCHGTARAFSKTLATAIQFPFSIGEDAYSYLFVKKHGYRFSYVKQTAVYYALPQTFEDHWKQSMRYSVSKKTYNAAFGSEFVRKHYQLPIRDMIQATVLEFLQHPVEVISYWGITVYILMLSTIRKEKVSDLWKVAESSKQVKA